MAELCATADVAVVGAGVMGTSAAYHLSATGTQVVIVERETVGAGSTSKAAGGFRCQFTDPLNVRIALESIRRLERFPAQFGVDIDFQQYGYLFLLQPDQVETFRAAIAIQNSYGSPSQLITPAQAQRIVPAIRTQGLAAAAYCPKDGYCTPEAVAQGYAQAAVRNGARLVQGCQVTEILAQGGQVTGLATNQGTITTDRVVLTGGVWSAALLQPLGINLPVQAVKRHVWIARKGEDFPRRLPLVIDFATGFYLQRSGNDILFGGPKTTLEEMAPIVARRVPSLLDREISSGWWGYYAVSPDHNALVGQAPGIAGLFYATGFSGHGFQQSPVMGEHLAELALGKTPTFDLAPFDMHRFTQNRAVPEQAIV